MKIKDQLKDLAVTPKKERGQNFLKDPGAIQDLLRFGYPQKGENLVEIGPGLGALTRELYAVSNLTVIEIESNFCTRLLEEYPNLNIINEDVRAVDFSELGSDLVIFGNLPYSLSTDIIFHLLSFGESIKRAVLMLQKEFVERMMAEPGGKEYGALSVACQMHCEMREGPILPGNLFHPPTRVDSQVVELTFRKQKRFVLSLEESAILQLIVKGSFFKRRKKLVNSIKASCYFDPRVIDQAVESVGLDPNRRAETLSIEEFVALAKQVHGIKNNQ